MGFPPWIGAGPDPMPDPSGIEIRFLFEVAHYAEATTSAQAKQEKRMREELEGR